MKFPLKYLVPALVLLIGILAMSINMYFYVSNEKTERIATAKERASVIGNRIANEIEKRELYEKDDYADLIRIVSQYTLEYLNMVKIFNENGEVIFKSVPVKFGDEFKYDTSSLVKAVIREVKANVTIDDSELHIDVIAPLLMPEKQSVLYTKNYGALYLQFDMSDIRAKSIENIIKHTIHNGLVILLMVVVLAILIYLLILKPLTELHRTTARMANGDMSVRLKVTKKNELGDLKRSFNEMAEKISTHHDEMNKKIEEAVVKNTEQNRMMLQQGRLAAMGEMINNIAHQWRQPLNTLGIVLQKLEFFRKNGTLDEKKLKESIDKGMFLIEKMTTTIDDFRDFFIKSKDKKVFFIKELVDEVLTLMEGTLNENKVSVILEIEESTQIEGYKNELMQVVLNIVNNAKDALVENRAKDRKIHISCIVKNEQMILEIKDNAGGIPESVIDKIFDPYFSTKEEGKGSGIGLYMSKTIIEDNMHGKLEVHNDESGAVFSIILFIEDMHPFCDTKQAHA